MSYVGNAPYNGIVNAGNIADGSVTANDLASTAISDKLGYTPANKAGDTFTNTVNATKFYANSPTATWATDRFPVVIKGLADGGFRALGVTGHDIGSSSWFGSVTSPNFALDTTSGTSENGAFWTNDGTSSIGNWFKMMQFNHGASIDIFGGGGGIALQLYNGGDFRVWNAANNYAANIWTDGIPTGSSGGNGDMIWMGSLCLRNQRTTYDRSWDNYPSITVLNHTDQGPQGEFRIHGANGVSGGDFSVVTRCDGGYVTGSDARRKTDVEAITGALATVQQLQGKKFNIINRDGDIDPMRGEKKQYGFIAQECKDLIPEAVTFYPESDTPNENGWASAYSIDYQSLVPVLVEAIKEQQQQIDTLKAEVAALKAGA